MINIYIRMWYTHTWYTVRKYYFNDILYFHVHFSTHVSHVS